MKQENENKLLADIENIRKKLNKEYDPVKIAPPKDRKAYSLSLELDRLINRYMKITLK